MDRESAKTSRNLDLHHLFLQSLGFAECVWVGGSIARPILTHAHVNHIIMSIMIYNYLAKICSKCSNTQATVQ